MDNRFKRVSISNSDLVEEFSGKMGSELRQIQKGVQLDKYQRKKIKELEKLASKNKRELRKKNEKLIGL